MIRSLSVMALTLAIAAGCLSRLPDPLSIQARNAQTAPQHRAVADAYRDRAQEYRQESAEHSKLAEWWSGLAGGRAPSTGTGRFESAQHCQRLSEYLTAAAAEADALAREQETLADQWEGR